jgi:hypothetical protein
LAFILSKESARIFNSTLINAAARVNAFISSFSIMKVFYFITREDLLQATAFRVLCSLIRGMKKAPEGYNV